MRASGGLRAGKQAEGTPSETDIPVHVRAYADMCCGRSVIADEGSDWRRGIQTPTPPPLLPQTNSDSGPAPRAVG